MRYSPILKTDRKHVGKFWHRRQIRAFQLILNATHGIVSHKPNFFYRAFGPNADTFLELLSMPLKYIINRDMFEKHIPESFEVWRNDYQILSTLDKKELLDVLEKTNRHHSSALDNILLHYEDDSSVVIPLERAEDERAKLEKKLFNVVLIK